MTSRFLKFIPWILEHETEFNKNGSVRTEHDPSDPGGTTRFGIDKRSHPRVDVEHLTKDQATEIYWQEWQKAECDAKPAKLGEVIFNCNVNCGAGRTQKILAVAGGSPARFLSEQVDFYKRLVAVRPKSQKYLRGWLRRVDDLRAHLGL